MRQKQILSWRLSWPLHAARRTKKHVEVVATIGSNVYTLEGDKLPPPGQYKARFWDNGDIELMGPNAKGELHTHRFKVVGIEAIPAK